MKFQDTVGSFLGEGRSFKFNKKVVIIDSKEDAGWIAFTQGLTVRSKEISKYQRMEVKSLFNDAFILMVDNQ